MIKILQNSSLFFALASLALLGCENDLPKNSHCTNFNSFENVMLNSYWHEISSNKGVAITKDSIYFIFGNEAHLGKSEAMVHYIREDGTFLNRDFLLNDSKKIWLKGQPKALSIYGVPKEKLKFEILALGEYFRKENQIEKVWDMAIGVGNINNKRSLYRNEVVTFPASHLLAQELQCAFERGVCFKNNKGFTFIINNGFLYILSKNPDSRSKFMVHFIYEKNKFLNQSFNFYDSNNAYPLTLSGETQMVAKIWMPQDEFSAIRIGEYNERGNLWVQLILPEELYNNPLLVCYIYN